MKHPDGPEPHDEIREGVRALCRQFDSAYWQKVDEERAYPDAFVEALTKAGWRALQRFSLRTSPAEIAATIA